MPHTAALHDLARALGVHTHYTDGLGNPVIVAEDTLVRVCAAMGAAIDRPADATEALREHAARSHGTVLPPVAVAWDGTLQLVLPPDGDLRAELRLEQGGTAPVELIDGILRSVDPLPLGSHRLDVAIRGRESACAVIAAPVQAFRRPGDRRSWGVGAQLAALRTGRSRAVGDLRDLEVLCQWLHGHGADLVTLLPLLPTFNTDWREPSPYSPVSRLFWSELMLDLGERHRAVGAVSSLDVTTSHAEVWSALADQMPAEESLRDEELVRYARFRGAQARLGRNWREWPATARDGALLPEHVEPEVVRFHFMAQLLARQQLGSLRARLDDQGFRLGLDLTVGVHSDGYDTWSRQHLFGDGISVGAPPDLGFPSGQDWGFSPVLPAASRAEGHRYLAATVAHQMAAAGVLRVDHIMAWTRLYWIPHGFGLHQGTYVSYPAEELFAMLTLESQRHRCEVVGENLGTVPADINEALPRHRIWGMYLAQFQAAGETGVCAPAADEVALIGTHDTPTFAGWLAATDVADRLQHHLLSPEAEVAVRQARAAAGQRLADLLGVPVDAPESLLLSLLDWLGRSESALVVPWLEDFWLEERGVNLPGTPSSERPNWQRPMRLLLDEVMTEPMVATCVRTLQDARVAAMQSPKADHP